MDKPRQPAYARAVAVECPDADTLGSLISDALPPSERAAVANHAAACPSCHEVISALVGSSPRTEVGWPGTEGTVPAGAVIAPGDPMQLRAGDQVDRYVIESRLGAGGMGVVYVARDPDLGRRVALKMLRAGAADDRLRREAQALARLSHPNVVAVHDVGSHAGQTFVAMALVEGDNLRRWLLTARPVREVVRLLLAAGRGLAAAHAAGLIHRDLKPDNIFVAAGGHALVGDFGLARDLADVLDRAGDPSITGLSSPDLTMTGTVVGTPAYMAPEQVAGEATAASDQFSFCVTAWEALYRARPYAGDTFEAIQAAIAAERIAAPTSDPGVPTGVRRALVRGLAADPAARFASIDELLAAMTPRPRRWPWLLGGAAALAGGGLALALLGGDDDRAPTAAAAPAIDCADQQALLDAWSPDRSAALAQVLTARAPDAADDIARVIAAIDRYAVGWNAARHDACLATHVRKQQSPERMAARIACLDQRALGLHTTVELITTTPVAPRAARQRVEALRSVDRCDRSQRPVVAPRSPALDEARLQLARLGARSNADDRGATLVALRRRIEQLDDPALLLDALLLEARVELDLAETVAAEVAAREALDLAERLGDDLSRAHAGALLSEALVRLDRLTEARGQLPQADAALERGGGDWEVGLVLAHARAIVASAAGDRDGELAALRAILAELRRVRGDDSVQVIDAAIDLSASLQRDGDVAGAAEVFALIEGSLGKDLPAREAAAGQAAFDSSQAQMAGEFPRAIELARQVTVIVRAMGKPPPDLAVVLWDLGAACELGGDWPCALDAYQQAEALLRALPVEARDPVKLIDALEGIARNQLQLGRAAAAIAPVREALAAARSLGDPDRVQTTALVLARALLATGAPDEVRTLIEPELRAIDAAPEVRATRRSAAAFLLAQALWETGGTRERERARSLAEDAVRDFDRAIAELDQPAYVVIRQMLAQRRDAAAAWQKRHP